MTFVATAYRVAGDAATLTLQELSRLMLVLDCAMDPDTPVQLRAKAQQIRDMMRSLSDEQALQVLRDAAQELETRATELEMRRPGG